MSTITTKDAVEIFYKDWGPKDAQPIVFHHGWPLSSDDWDAQMLFFLSKGYRDVAHDRRGHGRSSQVADGHDIDHYAADAFLSPIHSICGTQFTSAIPPVVAKWRGMWRDTASLRAGWPRSSSSPPFRR
jgi:pimeloyl-ACP methyl ester carboxylesterase